MGKSSGVVKEGVVILFWQIIENMLAVLFTHAEIVSQLVHII